MNEKTLTVFVTKYWSTRGIGPQKVTRSSFSDRYVYSDDRWRTQYIIGSTCFLDEEDARRAATEEARKKVKSLRAKADDLEKKWLR